MTSKERMMTIIKGGTPDRMGIWAGHDKELVIPLMHKHGIYDYQDLCVELGHDMLMSSTQHAILDVRPDHFEEGKDRYTCVWGCEWVLEKTKTGAYASTLSGPLENDTDGSKLEAYKIPEVPDSAYDDLRRAVEKYGDTHFILGYPGNLIWEPAYTLHGMEDSLMDMYIREDYMNKLFDKVMQYALGVGHKMIDLGAHGLCFSDDFGTQENLLMSADTFRKFIKPRMKMVIDELREHNPDIIIAHHSCGHIIPIIDDLIEVGVDILQPIQPSAMDPAELKEKFDGRITFWGGIDTQETLPYGTPDQVRAEIQLRKDTIGKGGGYVCSPGHVLQSDIPMENVFAFYDACKEVGKY